MCMVAGLGDYGKVLDFTLRELGPVKADTPGVCHSWQNL